eukprot:614913-Ditylum_brightwellii.AAC.1
MNNFYFIVDETITAGRTDTILNTLQMPKAFIDRVMYVALENVENVDFGREETTETNYNKASFALNLYSQHSDKALSRCAE